MDPSSLIRLKEEQKKGLSECLHKISQWEKFKSDYEELRAKLETLADKVSYEIMVPLGTQAFMPGRMMHTNEIMVLLGDNWFVERSSKQAAEIVGRRIKQCQKMLEDLDLEKQQFQNWMKYTSEIQESGDMVEIVEEYDAEKEEEWKEQHVKNVRSHRQKLAEERQAKETAHAPECREDDRPSEMHSDDELWDKLNRLEIEEAEKQELLSSSGENEHIPEDDGAVSFSPSEIQENSEDDEGTNLEEEEKQVRWQDQEEMKTLRITFTHTTSSEDHEHKPDDLQDPKEVKLGNVENVPVIQSPSDIYKCFQSSFSSEEPKSILKSIKNTIQPERRKPLFDDKESIPIVNVKETYPLPKYQKQEKKESATPDKTPEMAFTGKIQEKDADSTSDITPISTTFSPASSKPVSRFKASKQASKE